MGVGLIYFYSRSFQPKFANMEAIINKVAESGIVTINLEAYLPSDVVVFDLASFLFMGLILKEKDYRAALIAQDWQIYQDKNVILTCSRCHYSGLGLYVGSILLATGCTTGGDGNY